MNSIRFVLVTVFLMTSGFVSPALATSWSIDQSDLWWNAGESGWGIQFVQRGSTIFATMFVYDAAGNPTWYVATMKGTQANGGVAFTGDLYSTHGPWFGSVPFNPQAVTSQKVGTMTWQKQPPTPGTLNYSVNGVNVTKSLTRQPIGEDDYSGKYLAGFHVIGSGCTNPADNGVIDGAGTLTVTQNGSAVSMNFAAGGANCTFNGAYSQAGQLGNVSGAYTCIDGEVGTFSMSDGIVSPFAMAVHLSLASTTSGCHDVGQLGGVRSDH